MHHLHRSGLIHRLDKKARKIVGIELSINDDTKCLSI